MNIRSAEQHIDALLRYVNDLKETNPRMYKKSKDRLLDIAMTCNRVIGIISDILHEEVMNVDVDEFGGNASPEISDIVRSMENQISDLAEFVSVDPDDNKFNNKIIYNRYKDCLKSASTYRYYLSEVASDCAKLIWRWFDNRFVKSKRNNGFVYNLQKMKEWIPDFVILYAYHFKIGTLDDFENSINKWIIDIHMNGNTYAIPQEIYSLEKSKDSFYYTVESVILWDLLMDSDFSNLCDIDGDYFPYSDCIYDLVYRYNPYELDDYINYKVDFSILNKYGFVYIKSEGGDASI